MYRQKTEDGISCSPVLHHMDVELMSAQMWLVHGLLAVLRVEPLRAVESGQMSSAEPPLVERLQWDCPAAAVTEWGWPALRLIACLASYALPHLPLIEHAQSAEALLVSVLLMNRAAQCALLARAILRCPAWIVVSVQVAD